MIANSAATRYASTGVLSMKQILIFTVLIALAPAPARGQSVDAVTKNPQELADEKTLLQMEHDWNQALKARDVVWFEQNLAGDMTDIVSGNGALHTKEENIAALKTDKTVYDSIEFSELKVRVEGSAGVVTGITDIKARDERGRAYEVKFAFTDTFIKRDGRWQVWASQHTRFKP
jgi:ketosteroid isomerase-like protein